MPMTVNGIGTMYYGRRNDSSYQGECRQCRQPATLRSYDTGHYFVVLFIPLIPLGKKRIIDECSRCQRHWVAKQGDYEVAQRKTIAAALEAYQDEPSAEKALQLHATLLGYGEHTQAAKFRAEATEAYPENGEFFGGLAAQLEQAARRRPVRVTRRRGNCGRTCSLSAWRWPTAG